MNKTGIENELAAKAWKHAMKQIEHISADRGSWTTADIRNWLECIEAEVKGAE